MTTPESPAPPPVARHASQPPTAPPRRAPRRGARAVYSALLAALDAVLEEGVPRTSLVRAGLTTAQADEWQRGFVLAEELAQQLHAPHLRPGARLRSTRLRTRLVVVAASLGALARQAGLDRAGHPGFAQLRDALDGAYAWAGAAHDEALRGALSTSTSESAA